MSKNNVLAKIKLVSRPSTKFESQIILKKVVAPRQLNPEYKKQKPTCDLSLVGDNVFAVITYVNKVLNVAGQKIEADQFRLRSVELIDYMEVLELAEEFVEICI